MTQLELPFFKPNEFLARCVDNDDGGYRQITVGKVYHVTRNDSWAYVTMDNGEYMGFASWRFERVA